MTEIHKVFVGLLAIAFTIFVIPYCIFVMFYFDSLPDIDNVTKAAFTMTILLADMLYIGSSPVVNVIMKYPKHQVINTAIGISEKLHV